MPYEEEIRRINPLTLRGIAENCRARLPLGYRDRPWLLAYPNRNFAEIFTEEIQADAYSAAYTHMHIGKLNMVFGNAARAGAFTSPISVVDWGCGQGLATLALWEFLARRRLAQCAIREVILVEPSQVSISRAEVNVRHALPDAQIRVVRKALDDVEAADVRASGYQRVVHLFSNILDVDGISLKKVSENLAVNSAVDNVVLCASPFYPKLEQRYAAFMSYFECPLPFLWQDSRPFREGGSNYTYSLLVFKLDADRPRQIVHYQYYPAVHFEAGYALDCVFDAVASSDDARLQLRRLTDFKVFAPFEMVSGIRSTVNPVLAVLNNIVCRGLPTLSAIEIEDSFARELNCSRREDDYGGIRYASTLDDNVKEHIRSALNGFGTCQDDIADRLVFIPLAIARLHKILIEAIASGRMDCSRDEWNILVEEGDVPFAQKAIDVFREMYVHVSALLREPGILRLPTLQLTVIRQGVHNPAPNAVYDMVVRYSSKVSSAEPDFGEYRVRNDCVFFVCSSDSQSDPLARRRIMTSDQVEYRELVTKNADGLYSPIDEPVSHLRYFLRLIFRKHDFRPGQLPILSRAIRNQSVIGLLPTGGGKSLTYQLAAMLQPGVTLVIDPLISLMHDQYGGLKRMRIDCCAEINSRAADPLESEKQMASSRLLFVFVSPERLCIMRFRRRMEDMNDLGVFFSYGVIDEVHCVSEWGHDFRFSYLHLGRNLYRYVKPRGYENGRHIALFGLTATASFDVLSDVERDLSGEGAFPLDAAAVIRYENTNRLELQYRVVNVPADPHGTKWDVYREKNRALPLEVTRAAQVIQELGTATALSTIRRRFIEREGIADASVQHEIESRDLIIDVAGEWVGEHPNRSAGIVFCPHRRGSIGVEDTDANNGIRSAILNQVNVPEERVAKFVGGDELDEQNRFLRGDSSIMVSTKAFGMGIDKPNVRFTWHVNYSGSLESFVQEAGRAGRDGKMALATILFCPNTFQQLDGAGNPVDIPYDLDVHKYFFDMSFRGREFEKMVMHLLMSLGTIVVETSDGEQNRTVQGFLNELINAEIGDQVTCLIPTYYNANDRGAQWLQNQWVENRRMHAQRVQVMFNDNAENEERRFIRDNYRDVILKAIYRMCCIGVVDDYTEDYANSRLRVVAIRRADDDYFHFLKRFLMRYYTEKRAEAEIDVAKNMNGETSIHKCLAYLTEFIYSKIAKKRSRAMWDMDSFCREAVDSQKDWLEVNEDLKDFIYYYFNSKYARVGYATESGEPFSLTDDTDGGKQSSFDIVFKYMRVIDDDITGAEGSPRDNIKHLQGAVRLIRRSLTDENPSLDLLNVFCLLFLKREIEDSENLKKELWSSYHQGYCDFRDACKDVGEFLDGISRFTSELKMRNVIDDEQVRLLSQWQAEAEVVCQAKWMQTFASDFKQ